MLDAVAIFTKGGVVLWSFYFVQLNSATISDLVSTVLLEGRHDVASATVPPRTFRWRLSNDLGIVTVLAYQGQLAADFVEGVINGATEAFMRDVGPRIKNLLDVPCPSSSFDSAFQSLVASREDQLVLSQRPRAGRESVDRPPPRSQQKVSQKSGGARTKGGSSGREESGSAGEEEDTSESGSAAVRLRARNAARGGRRGAPAQRRPPLGTASSVVRGEHLSMGLAKNVSKADAEALDFSKKDEEEEAVAAKAEASAAETRFFWNGDASAASAPRMGLIWSAVDALSAAVHNAGSRDLTASLLDPTIQSLTDLLVSRNVAVDVATQLMASVKAQLVGRRAPRFRSLAATVKAEAANAIKRALTPKRSIDVLKAAMEAKAGGRVYTIVFVGVNGVGKSTNLAKVCYYLKQNFRVMIAACDTFRSGAVEQLRVHANNLGVTLFEQGYGRDAATIAKYAGEAAARDGYDVVLVDTAGRMQDNQPLMRSLSKLIAVNTPDLVLFVGEALVGNDSIDQLTKFGRALREMTPSQDRVRGIDGILLTKFDTVDEKVGAALSMAFLTGQPILFVGTGQKYTHLQRLRADDVAEALLAGAC